MGGITPKMQPSVALFPRDSGCSVEIIVWAVVGNEVASAVTVLVIPTRSFIILKRFRC